MQEREAACRDLAHAAPPAPTTDADINAVAAWFSECAGRLMAVLASADPRQKQKLYEELNVRAYYQPGDDHIEVSAMPQVGKGRVGGGT